MNKQMIMPPEVASTLDDCLQVAATTIAKWVIEDFAKDLDSAVAQRIAKEREILAQYLMNNPMPGQYGPLLNEDPPEPVADAVTPPARKKKKS
jgi:hypothetical protein